MEKLAIAFKFWRQMFRNI